MTAASRRLHELLAAGAAHDAEYAGGLSNHRPMALVALARLGADSAELDRFDRAYSPRLLPAPPTQAWPAGDAWADPLGRRAAWPVYRDLFGQWLLHEDGSQVLRQVLPVLMQGCGAAAFHGLIRTAYAVQAGHHQELADALAYWACRWLDLGTSSFEGHEADPEVLLRHLPVVHSDAGLIFQRMQVAAAQQTVQGVVQQLRVGPGTLRQLSLLAARAYAASGNFTALHLLTSAHALRVLSPWLGDGDGDLPAAALRAYWRAFASAVCVAGLRQGPPVPPWPWPQVLAQARQTDDDHVIKVVDSCRQQQAAYGEAIWRRAATRAVWSGRSQELATAR